MLHGWQQWLEQQETGGDGQLWDHRWEQKAFVHRSISCVIAKLRVF